MSLADLISVALTFLGALFMFAGTVGLLRFPDVYTRLHALSKADNLGLGFLTVGLALQAGSVAGAVKLLLIWLLALVASATCCHLIARAALRVGVRLWRQP